MADALPDPPPLTDVDATLNAIEDAVYTIVQTCDPHRALSRTDVSDISQGTIEVVFAVMQDEGRHELNESDISFIETHIRRMVRDCIYVPEERRFAKLDRVVCSVGGERGWAPGTVQAVDEDDEDDPTGMKQIPYIVKIDPPDSRLVNVPLDQSNVIVPEVCFGQREGGLWFTRMCLPKAIKKGSRRVTQRFREGDRVACAVEDETGDLSNWAAGTVMTVDFKVDDCESIAGGVAPYQVLLDSGCTVIPHQDMHWLIRDLRLQPVGPCIGADGVRNIKRMIERKASADDSWEAIDHM